MAQPNKPRTLLGFDKGPDYGYGQRLDGTNKGQGFFGPLKRLDNPNDISTELSSGFEIDGKEVQLPLLVPTLSRLEIDHLLSGGQSTPGIDRKAIEFAIQRMRAGKSPFAGPGEQVPLPK